MIFMKSVRGYKSLLAVVKELASFKIRSLYCIGITCQCREKAYDLSLEKNHRKTWYYSDAIGFEAFVCFNCGHKMTIKSIRSKTGEALRLTEIIAKQKANGTYEFHKEIDRNAVKDITIH